MPPTLGDTPIERVSNVMHVVRALFERLPDFDERQEALYRLIVTSDCVERVSVLPSGDDLRRSQPNH